MGNKQVQGILSGLSASAIWGGMYVVSKVVLLQIPVFSLLTVRLLIGIGILGIFLIFQPRPQLRKKQILHLLMVGLLGFGVSLGFQFVGTSLSTAANASVVTAATPAFVFLFASRILAEPITRRGLLALLVSTIGVLILVDPGTQTLSPDLFWGNFYLVIAALTWALYSVLIRKYGQEIPILVVSWLALVGGLVVSLPLTLVEIARQVWWPLDARIIAGVLYLGIISTALAFFLWNKAFEILDAGLAGLTFFAQPVVGALLAWYFLGENLTPNFLVGGMMVLFGVWLASSE